MPGSPRRYIAVLGATNVGGRSTMRMADLRAQFEALGLTEVPSILRAATCCSPRQSTIVSACWALRVLRSQTCSAALCNSDHGPFRQ
ncbi:MAG: DUF1697 domain-containing protein [Chloroflexota bacterium]